MYNINTIKSSGSSKHRIIQYATNYNNAEYADEVYAAFTVLKKYGLLSK